MAMFKLVYLIKNHLLSLLGAILLGILGHISALLIPVLGVLVLFRPSPLLWLVLVLALLRGLLRYSEQYLNHLVAFKILADLRSIIFKKLRTLTPGILESEDRGDLVSMVSGDIELLEVFYAHTISPLFIAILMMIFVGVISPKPGVTLISHLLVGFVIPIVLFTLTQGLGKHYRSAYSQLSSLTYEYAQGYDTLEQFNQLEPYQSKMNHVQKELNHLAWKMNIVESFKGMINELVMWGGALALILIYKGQGLEIVSIALAIHLSSFGPVLSLSGLIQNLYQTFSCADRVVDLLEQEPMVEDIVNGSNLDTIEALDIKNIEFGYDNNSILKDYSLTLKPGVYCISGESGCGKSTLLKLISRIFDVDSGEILINNLNLKNINTPSLREHISFMSQDPFVFSGTFLDNVLLVDPTKTRHDVIEACKKASIHDFIMSLDKGYDTPILHRGENLSAGEKQRLALARVFLHDGDLVLLDEITSNLDYMNEKIILNSINQYSNDKIVLLVSHRTIENSYNFNSIQMY